MSANNAESIKKLYEKRDEFVLIGLTGRTGSGCTTVSEILSTDDMKNLSLHAYKTRDFENVDERKYSIIYRFMKDGKRWEPFTVIEASSIIFSFIMQEEYQHLWKFIDDIKGDGRIISNNDIKSELAQFLLDDENATYEMVGDIVIDTEIEKAVKCIDEYSDDSDEIIDLLTKRIKNKKNRFAELLRECRFEKNNNGKQEIYNFYTYFMQHAGNNIRSSGKYYDKTREPGHEFSVVQRIDSIIGLIVKDSGKRGKRRTRICIDALRNPMEIEFFRDKYRAFYSIAVITEDIYRQNRLGYSKKEIESIDKIEYPDGQDYYFYHQNIEACLQISDIYVYNPDISNNRFYELSEQLLKYIALILQPGLVTPTHIERCMQLAFNAKYNSGCLSRKVGAIVTGDDFSIRAVGWNDVPKGQVPCNLRSVEDYYINKDISTFSDYELNDERFDKVLSSIKTKLNSKQSKNHEKGKLYAYCFKDIYNGLTGKSNQVFTRALHAEENAFLQISKYGGSGIQGGKLFSTASPCELCSKKAYQLGIKEIYYIDPYPGISKTHILSFGKVNNPKMILFKGAIGNAYISLYSPKLPYKDEIMMVTGVSAKECSEMINNE